MEGLVFRGKLQVVHVVSDLEARRLERVTVALKGRYTSSESMIDRISTSPIRTKGLGRRTHCSSCH
jgi:hypothetical protein